VQIKGSFINLFAGKYITTNRCFPSKMDTESTFMRGLETKARITFELSQNSPYYLLREIDDTLGFSQPPQLARQKRLVLETLCDDNLLAKAVYDKKTMRSDHPKLRKIAKGTLDFNETPVTLFGVHEFLRHARYLQTPGEDEKQFFEIDGEAVSYEKLLERFEAIIPNTNLTKVNDKSYLLTHPLIVPVASGLLTAASLYEKDKENSFGKIVLAGAITGSIAAAVTKSIDRHKYGRDISKTAPWNATLYMDTHVALFRDKPDLLYIANRQTIPRPEVLGLKWNSLYYPHVKAILDGTYISVLNANYAALADNHKQSTAMQKIDAQHFSAK